MPLHINAASVVQTPGAGPPPGGATGCWLLCWAGGDEITKGDLFAVPSWCEVTLRARTQVDLFRFSDEPVYEALGLARTTRGEQK